MSLWPWLVIFIGHLLADITLAAGAEKKKKGKRQLPATDGAGSAQRVAVTEGEEPEGPPDLPGVPEMMGKSFDGFGSLALKLSTEADNFAAEVHRLQQDETDRMARMKAELEQALADQVAQEKELTAKKNKLAAEVQQTRAEVKTLRQTEKEMRNRLSTAARAFEREQGRSVAGALRGAVQQSTRQAAPEAEKTEPAADGAAQSAQLPADEDDDAADLVAEGAADASADTSLVSLGASRQLAHAGKKDPLPSHVPAEEAAEGSAMLGQLRGMAASLGQMLRLERQTENRYVAAYRSRLQTRKEHVEKLDAESKRLQNKLNSLRHKRERLRASVKKLGTIYSGLTQATPSQDDDAESD